MVTTSYKGLPRVQAVTGDYNCSQDDIGGYKRLQGLTWGRGRYNWLQRLTRNYMGLQEITFSSKELKGLEGVTGSLKGLQGLTTDYRGLQGVTRGNTRCLCFKTLGLQIVF